MTLTLDSLSDQVGALAVQVIDAATTASSAKTEIARLAVAVKALATATAKNASAADELPPVKWLTITDPELAVETLTAVSGWVSRIWVHFTPIDPCWPWHPAVVEELVACRQAWLSTEAPPVSPLAAADWLTRWRPAAAREIARHMKPCNGQGGHKIPGAGNNVKYRVNPAATAEYAHWWATRNPRSTGSVPPGLEAMHR